MYFSDFSGQDFTKTQLLDLFKSARVPHGLLLNGEEGCGHLQLALSFSCLLLCQDPTPIDACKKCSSCKMFEKHMKTYENHVKTYGQHVKTYEKHMNTR